ncbi:putative membrane protein [Fimbriiglobus ruber]|uniref:Putative membrane protein n=2 Tax=Fimbriiglobus ruber TaxID=1908690 RepID=A0A225EFU3_9BACT|nr:putative membrane protein [Fimbriiglobus ruber]
MVAGVVLVALVPPTAESIYPKCASYQLFGIHCPGCGLTRAVHSAATGHFEQAFAYNPLMVAVSPYLAFAVLRAVWFQFWGEQPQTSIFPKWLGWTSVVVMVVYAVLRNIPVYPLTLLAPHELTQ